MIGGKVLILYIPILRANTKYPIQMTRHYLRVEFANENIGEIKYKKLKKEIIIDEQYQKKVILKRIDEFGIDDVGGKTILLGISNRIRQLNENIEYLETSRSIITNRGVSFISFVFNSFESLNRDIHSIYYLIRLLFYFQMLISISIWGYITMVIYRILDGK